MGVLKFPENDNTGDFRYNGGIRLEKLYEESLYNCVGNYQSPDNPEKFLMSTRQLPTCIEFVLSKKAKGYHNDDSSKHAANKRKVIACAMNWGLSRLRSVPEYKELIEGRLNKSIEIKSADEARLYRSRNSRGIFKRVREMETYDHPYVLQADEYSLNMIGEYAPVLMMANYELAIFLLCLGLRWGDKDESHLNEKYRLSQWEIDNLDDVIQIAQVHMRTLADEIRRFEYQQSIKTENLFN